MPQPNSNPVIKIDAWPGLPSADWQDTYATLHMWTQIVGKVRLTLTPLMETLLTLAIEVRIRAKPDEVADPVPFAEDQKHASYDAKAANRFWRILVQCNRVFKQFRARFIGKCSPAFLLGEL